MSTNSEQGPSSGANYGANSRRYTCGLGGTAGRGAWLGLVEETALIRAFARLLQPADHLKRLSLAIPNATWQWCRERCTWQHSGKPGWSSHRSSLRAARTLAGRPHIFLRRRHRRRAIPRASLAAARHQVQHGVDALRRRQQGGLCSTQCGQALADLRRGGQGREHRVARS